MLTRHQHWRLSLKPLMHERTMTRMMPGRLRLQSGNVGSKAQTRRRAPSLAISCNALAKTKVAKSSQEMSHAYVIDSLIQDLLSALSSCQSGQHGIDAQRLLPLFGNYLEDPKRSSRC